MCEYILLNTRKFLLFASKLALRVIFNLKKNSFWHIRGCSCDQVEVAIMEFMICTSGNGSTSERIDYFRKKYKKVFEDPYSSRKMHHVSQDYIQIIY